MSVAKKSLKKPPSPCKRHGSQRWLHSQSPAATGIPARAHGRVLPLTAFLSKKMFQMSFPKIRESLAVVCWQTSVHK